MSQKRHTDEEIIEAIYAADGVITTAAQSLGCSARTIYNYAEESQPIKDAMKSARRGLVGEAQSYLVGMMRDPTHRDHYKAVMKILTTYDGDTDWSDRQQLTGKDGEPLIPIQIEIVNAPKSTNGKH